MLTRNISYNPAPVVATKVLYVNVATLSNNPQVFLPYDKEISNSKTIGIRVYTGNYITDETVFSGTLAVGANGMNLISIPQMQYLQINLYGPGNSPDCLHKDLPLTSLLGLRARAGASIAGLTPQVVTKQFNKQIDPGNSYLFITDPSQIPAFNNEWTALEFTFVPIKK